MNIPQDVIAHSILPMLDIEELYQLRNAYPRAFNESVNSSMKTLPGAVKVLQLALVIKNKYLLDFVVNSLFVYSDNYGELREEQIYQDNRMLGRGEVRRLIEEGRDNNYGHVFNYAFGSGDTSEEAALNSRLALEGIFVDALREGNVELVAIMLSDGITPPTYGAWISDQDIFEELTSGTLEAVTILTSVEVMSTLNPSLYETYGALFEPSIPYGDYEYVDYHVKAIERLYAALGYIPEAVKRAAIGRLNMNDGQFINHIHQLAIDAHKEMQLMNYVRQLAIDAHKEM